MKVYSLMLGSYQTNCYLAADDDGVCAVIDPGYTPERVLEAAQRYGLTIRAVLLTHGHFDHVGGVRGVAEAARCPVWLCEADTVLPERLTAGRCITPTPMPTVTLSRSEACALPCWRRRATRPAPCASCARTSCSPATHSLQAPAAVSIWQAVFRHRWARA